MSRDDLPDLPGVLKKKQTNVDIIAELKNKLRAANGKIGGLQSKLNRYEKAIDGSSLNTTQELEEKIKVLSAGNIELVNRNKDLEDMVKDKEENAQTFFNMVTRYENDSIFYRAILEKLVGIPNA